MNEQDLTVSEMLLLLKFRIKKIDEEKDNTHNLLFEDISQLEKRLEQIEDFLLNKFKLERMSNAN